MDLIQQHEKAKEAYKNALHALQSIDPSYKGVKLCRLRNSIRHDVQAWLY